MKSDPTTANNIKSSSSNPKSKKPIVIYLPPVEDAPQKGRIHSSERPICPEVEKVLTALVPKWHLALTIAESPTFWFYVPYAPNATNSVSIVLWDEEQNKIEEATSLLNNTPGIIKIKLPNTILEVNKRYKVNLTVTCSNKDSTSNSKGGKVLVTTWLKRVDLDNNLASQLKTATPREKYTLYAANGIWYEALTELIELKKSQDNDQQVIQDWQDFLSQPEIDLPELISEPIVSCCTAK